MTLDANRPYPELLTAEMIKEALQYEKYTAPLAFPYVQAAKYINKLLADRLAQAQREAAQARVDEAKWWRKHGIWPDTAEFEKFRERIADLERDLAAIAKESQNVD